jgi:hypothetical protein
MAKVKYILFGTAHLRWIYEKPLLEWKAPAEGMQKVNWDIAVSTTNGRLGLEESLDPPQTTAKISGIEIWGKHVGKL